ncbi:hypothetical protein DAPPUDRAFT_314113 [Daphnia pulex]|uniref:CUB domain-containing protein n=1 Tax=Daphnia pulex TaxID=6669 RepID=E9G4Q6_DAPPU|nr:hypothetical protein DAPPUDRAFT_314113 [Daphnia pulex]|eukprot:EFX85341.1 hypothetical protein DAPPUDRAFT_314113 [Daphnia pulex]
MKFTSLKLFLLAGITVCWAGKIPAVLKNSNPFLKVDPLTARALLNNNFESGNADPWYDSSPNTVHWVVEDFSSPTENYPPPTLPAGTKYLRATRDAQATPGQLVLRTATFTAFPGDEISFNFWIRSKYTGGNVLELVLSNGGVETSLAELSVCGGTYNSASGTVTSPNYPSPYGFDEDCRYKISIPSGNGIKLTFNYFNTENGYDFVTVYDGLTAASAVLLRTSGYNVNLSVTTSTRDCLIMHTSDWKNSLAEIIWTAYETKV